MLLSNRQYLSNNLRLTSKQRACHSKFPTLVNKLIEPTSFLLKDLNSLLPINRLDLESEAEGNS